jgi:hypothetical protein
MLLLIVFYQVGGVDLDGRLPCVVAIRVSHPFDQILKFVPLSHLPVSHDALHLVFFFAVYQFQWGSGEVWAVGGHLVIGR